jgi:hypothetical protein
MKLNLACLFLSALITTATNAVTRRVYPGKSIQDAVDAATSGDTIFVYKGTYTNSDPDACRGDAQILKPLSTGAHTFCKGTNALFDQNALHPGLGPACHRLMVNAILPSTSSSTSSGGGQPCLWCRSRDLVVEILVHNLWCKRRICPVVVRDTPLKDLDPLMNHPRLGIRKGCHDCTCTSCLLQRGSDSPKCGKCHECVLRWMPFHSVGQWLQSLFLKKGEGKETLLASRRRRQIDSVRRNCHGVGTGLLLVRLFCR